MRVAILATPAAREGCLAYLRTLSVVQEADLMQLRTLLQYASPAQVAEAMWAGYHAAQESDDPLEQAGAALFAAELEEIMYSLERLAEEPEYFLLPQAA